MTEIGLEIMILREWVRNMDFMWKPEGGEE